MPTIDPASALGITFTFDGDTYTATSISVSRSAAEFDCTSTDIASGGKRRYRTGDLENCEIKVDWIGLTVPTIDQTASFSVTAGSGGGAALGSTGTVALCTGLNITAQAGELIKGSATFKVSYD